MHIVLKYIKTEEENKENKLTPIDKILDWYKEK